MFWFYRWIGDDCNRIFNSYFVGDFVIWTAHFPWRNVSDAHECEPKIKCWTNEISSVFLSLRFRICFLLAIHLSSSSSSSSPVRRFSSFIFVYYRFLFRLSMLRSLWNTYRCRSLLLFLLSFVRNSRCVPPSDESSFDVNAARWTITWTHLWTSFLFSFDFFSVD